MAGRAWMLFLIGVVVSTFVGGGIRVLLSPEVISHWAKDAVAKKEPKFNFQFESAKLSLADGWKPHLAVELTGLTISAKDKCVTESVIAIDRTTIPIRFSALMKKKIQLGNVRAGLVELNVKGSRCSTRASDWTGELASLESFFRRRWDKEVANTTTFITNLNVDTLRVREGTSIEPKFQIMNLEIEFLAREHQAKATFEFWPGIDWVGIQPFGPTQTALHISNEGMKWSAKGNLKEGQIHFNGSWRVEKSNLVLDADWTDVPLSPLAKLLTRWQMIDFQNLNPENEWSSCRLAARGSVREWRDLIFVASDCRLNGDLGNVEIVNNEWPLLKGEITPFQASLKKINVRAFTGLFDMKPFKNVSNFGVFDGKLNYDQNHDWKMAGVIHDAEVYSALFDGNHKRPMGPLDFEASYVQDKLTARFAGEDTFNMHLNFETVFDREAGGTIRSRLFSREDVQIQTGSLGSFPFESVDLKLDGRFDGHHFFNLQGTASLGDIELGPAHPFFSVAQQMGLALSADEAIRLPRANVAFTVEDDGLRVSGPVQTAILGKTVQIEAHVDEGRINEGNLTLLDNGRNIMNLILEGSLSRPTVTE